LSLPARSSMENSHFVRVVKDLLEKSLGFYPAEVFLEFRLFLVSLGGHTKSTAAHKLAHIAV
jgi:hypothetical protein